MKRAFAWLRSDRAGIWSGVLVALIVVLVGMPPAGSQAMKTGGVVSIGGSVTEIVFALGEEHRLVARDTTSIYPPAALDLPDAGYVRALSPEGVLSLGPSLIIAEAEAGPPETIAILEEAEVPFVTAPGGYSRAGVREKILTVGDALGVPDKAARLAATVDANIAEAARRAAASDQTPKRVLFVLSTQGGRIMASGSGTAADAIMKLAGGVNAITGFEGYRPLTDEVVSASAPDVILMMDRSGGHSASNATLFDMPALRATPAAVRQAVVRMDGLLLLGFGPRTGQAVRDLNAALYGPAG